MATGAVDLYRCSVIAAKAEAGFAALHWPAEWGGRALPPIYQVIYAQEETRYLVPRGYFEIGLGMCMPTLFAFGTASRTHAVGRCRYCPRGAPITCPSSVNTRTCHLPAGLPGKFCLWVQAR